MTFSHPVCLCRIAVDLGSVLNYTHLCSIVSGLGGAMFVLNPLG